MKPPNNPPRTAAELIEHIEQFDVSAVRRRDMISATKRICAMAGIILTALVLESAKLRVLLRKILPAAHGVSKKTYSNMRSQFTAALELANILQRPKRGLARRHPDWKVLMAKLTHDVRLANGIAAFANWCSAADVTPCDVTDNVVLAFHDWLTNQTLHLKPNAVVRKVPVLWNECRERIDGWPDIHLTSLSFRAVSEKLSWDALSDAFRRDAEAYLAMRAKPDIFDERPNAPRRPLAQTTLRQQREHLRLAVSVLVQTETAVTDITSLADLTDSQAMKTILRHYHDRANGQPNAFAICLAKTIIQVAQHHTKATSEHVAELKKIAAKLPSVPFDLTDKNRALLRHFESERNRAALLYLPERLLSEAKADLDGPRLPFVKAQIGIAVDIQLVAPLRPQNLIRLKWQQHVHEPDGSTGRLKLHIPAGETKTGKRELIYELPTDVANRLRWYRRKILPRLGADLDGYLFVTSNGKRKSQETLCDQVVAALKDRLGVHMTPHQFRHLAATLYLDANPSDFETVRALLGHAFSKTTLIYAGASGQRASRIYGAFLQEIREELRLKRPRRTQPAKRT